MATTSAYIVRNRTTGEVHEYLATSHHDAAGQWLTDNGYRSRDSVTYPRDVTAERVSGDPQKSGIFQGYGRLHGDVRTSVGPQLHVMTA